MERMENAMMQKRIRVAIICGSMNIGGGEVMAARLSTYINRNQFEVKLFIIGKYMDNQISRLLNSMEVNYVCLGLISKFTWKNYCDFSKALQNFKPDIVHAHLDVSYSWIWTILHHKPLVFTLHSNPYRWLDKRVYFVMKLKALQGNLRIVGCAGTIAEYAKKCYRLSNKQVTFIYNPIDCEKYSLGSKMNKRVKFIHVGRFNAVKNHRMLITAFAELEKKFSEVELLLAGDGKLFVEMQDYVKNIGSKNIHFLGNVNNVSTILSQSDILVLSSDSEACPMVILEAMASGLPIIATKVGGIPELVTNNGLLVNKGDIKGLTEAMYRLACDKELRNEMGKKSLISARQFDKSIIVKKYEFEYTQLVKK